MLLRQWVSIGINIYVNCCLLVWQTKNVSLHTFTELFFVTLINRHTFIRVILTISYLILFLGFTLGLDNNSTVLAQNTIEVDRSLKNLSPQENEDLDRGKVIFKKQRGKYLGQIVATGYIDTAWELK